ncbi:unnamed protein product [Diamesa serratosioi]
MEFDELLADNPFFNKLQNIHNILLETAALENWIICIPRKIFINTESLNSHEFLLSHILIPNEDCPKTHFTSLNSDPVRLDGKKIKLKAGSKKIETEILFEEIFYSKEMLKYKVYCIGTPLNLEFIDQINISQATPTTIVKNFTEAYNLISKHAKSKQIFKKIDFTISNFIQRSQNNNSSSKLQVNVKLLYDYCLNILLRRRGQQNDTFEKMNLKIALEYYLFETIYEKVFDDISIRNSEENVKFNKLLRKLEAITPADLNISPDLLANFGMMKSELNKLESAKTTLDKLNCIKNAIDAVSKRFNNNKSTSLDDILPIFVYTIIKSGRYDWMNQLKFIKEYDMALVLEQEHCGMSYLATTFEAVLFYIQTNENLKISDDIVAKTDKKSVDNISSKEDYLNCLFQYVLENNEIDLVKLIKVNYSTLLTTNDDEKEFFMCHPLCSCLKCQLKVVQMEPNVNLRSENGLTLLHVAAFYGEPKMISILLNLNANVNATNVEDECTPLHFAATRGHQHVLFLLLHGKSDINAKTSRNQTPLHLAAMNGHGCCVKALLYFAEHVKEKINLNVQDYNGNTPLHYSAQNGFDDITESLLEYTAKVNVFNNIGKTPIDYAFTSKLRNFLESSARYQFEELPVNENDYVFISNEDLADIETV